MSEPRRLTGKFAVVRLFDNGSHVIVNRYATWEAAAARAGAMRDAMTDDECSLDYNYRAVQLH